MEMKELLQFIALEDRRLEERSGPGTQKEAVLARTVKLAEELGELCDGVLAHYQD